MHAFLRKSTMIPALIMCAPLFVGCASSQAANKSANAPQAAEKPATGETCFNASMATGFDYLRPRYMYVTVVGDKHYLLTLAQECIDLQSAMNISIRSRFEQVCSRSMDSIVFVALGTAHNCRITNIEQVKDRAAAEALVKEYTTPKKSSG